MPTYPPLLDSAVLFAHRGARAHAPEYPLEAFTLGLRLGATGLESDVWLTADGVAVLDHDTVDRLAEAPVARLDPGGPRTRPWHPVLHDRVRLHHRSA